MSTASEMVIHINLKHRLHEMDPTNQGTTKYTYPVHRSGRECQLWVSQRLNTLQLGPTDGAGNNYKVLWRPRMPN